MSFCLSVRRARFAARSLNTHGMYSITRRAAVNGLLSKNLRPQRKRNFPVLQGGGTHKCQAYFKDDNAAKLNNSHSRRRIVLFVLSKHARCNAVIRVEFALLPYCFCSIYNRYVLF